MADKKKQDQQDIYLDQLRQMVPGINSNAVSKVRILSFINKISNIILMWLFSRCPQQINL